MGHTTCLNPLSLRNTLEQQVFQPLLADYFINKLPLQPAIVSVAAPFSYVSSQLEDTTPDTLGAL